MKKTVLMVLLVALLGFSIFTEEKIGKIQIRAFQKNKFVSDLKISDIKITQNKNILPITGILRIDKNIIAEKKGEIDSGMNLQRNHIFIFSIRNYSNPIGKSIQEFFKNVILKGDTVSVLSPMKSYSLNNVPLDSKSRKKFADSLVAIIQKDILNGNRKYMDRIKQLASIVRDASRSGSGLGSSASTYERLLQELEFIREKFQKLIFNYIAKNSFKKGQNLVYFFYEKESYPYPKMESSQGDMLEKVLSEFAVSKRASSFNPKKLKEKFRLFNIVINSVFYKGKSIRSRDVYKEDNSRDMYEIFRSFADVTGGKFEDSKNPLKFFKDIVDFTNNYYIILFKRIADIKNETPEVKLTDSNKKMSYRFIYEK